MTKPYIHNNNLKARDKLILCLEFIILIGFIMIVIFSVSYNYFKSKSLDDKMNYNMELVYNISTSIDDYLSDIEKDLKVLSISKEIQSIGDGEDIETIEKLVNRFEEYSNVHEEVKNIYFATPDKKMYKYPYANIYESIDVTERQWYVDAVNTKDYVWSDNVINKETGEIVKIVSIPVFNNDKLIGVLGIEINLSIIEKKFKNIHFGKTGYITLVDEEGKTLIHPSKDVIGKTLDIDVLKQAIKRKHELGYFKYSWDETEKIMFYSMTNKGDFIVIGSVIENELATNEINFLVMLMNLSIISTIILTLFSILISISYGKKQLKHIDKQQIVRDNYKESDDLKDKLDRLEEYKANGTLTKEEYEVKREHIIKNYEI